LCFLSAIRRPLFAPSPAARFRDRYQEALQELIEAKLKGRVIAPAHEGSPSPVIDLLAALKGRLAEEKRPRAEPKAKRRASRAADRASRACFFW
jgi:non-homologous end joining protein Ku